MAGSIKLMHHKIESGKKTGQNYLRKMVMGGGYYQQKEVKKEKNKMRLYYHKTDGGAEYLTDKYVLCPTGHKEGIFEGAKYIVRIDGNIEKDAELLVWGE